TSPRSSVPCSWHTSRRRPAPLLPPSALGYLSQRQPRPLVGPRPYLSLPPPTRRWVSWHSSPTLPRHSQCTQKRERHGDHRVCLVEALGIEPRRAIRTVLIAKHGRTSPETTETPLGTYSGISRLVPLRTAPYRSVPPNPGHNSRHRCEICSIDHTTL